MQIRQATVSDELGVAAVLKECYNIDTFEEGQKVFTDERMKGVHYIVAIEEDEIVGLTTWYIHGLAKHGLAELDRIAVLEKVRGKGVARQLFEALKMQAKEFYEKHGATFRKLYLLTHESNERAHAFYEKMGLTHETTLKKHYYDHEDERVYSVFIE